MSFVTFAKTALGEELAKLGFERKSGVDWFKLIGDCIWLRFRFRQLSYGTFEVHFGIQSLFSKLFVDDTQRYTSLQFNAAMLYRQRELAKGVALTRIDMFPMYEDENSDDGRAAIAKVKEMFSVVNPLLASVHDLKSCKRAIELADYMQRYPHLSHELDSELERKGFTAWPPEDVFFILCRQGRHAEAADYLRHDIKNYGDWIMKTHDAEFCTKLVADEKARLDLYIEMIERGENDRIERIMRGNYCTNCDMIEKNFKIRIDRSKVLFNQGG